MLPTALLVATVILAAGAITFQSARHRTALRENRAKVHTLLEHSPEAIVVLDVESGTFSEVNGRAERLFGRSREELLKLNPMDVSPPVQPNGESSGEAAGRALEEAAAGGVPEFEWWHQNAAGDAIPCEVRLVRLPARGRTLVRGSIVDISRRKAAEERHRALEEQLRQSSKLEAVGQLTGGVAHDFNNILTVAMGNLELVLDGIQTDSDLSALARESLDALNRAAVLTARLLAFSRRQPLRPETLDVGELVEGMTGLLRRTLGESIEIEESIDADLWDCRTDRAQLENSIINLAVNARDAMPTGGTLHIDVRNRHASAVEMDSWFGGPTAALDGVAVPASRDFLEISVRDNGTGMDAVTLERAFDPFYTTKEVGRGSGLGLSTIYGFAKQSEGHAAIESAPGDGTTVRLRLPRVIEEPESAPLEAETAVETRPDQVKGGRVLVVEDDPGVRDVGVAFLESMGYSCVPVSDAIQALSFLEHDPRVDILFTDVILPGGVNGIDLAHRVRKMLPHLPIVFCSGYSAEIVGDLADVQDLWPLISKPYTREDLAAVL